MRFLIVTPEMEDTNYRGVQFVTKHILRGLSEQGHEVILLTSHPKVKINVKSEKLKWRVLNTYFRQYLQIGAQLTKRMAPRAGIFGSILGFLVALVQKAPMITVDKTQTSGLNLVKYIDKAVNLPFFYRMAVAMPKIFRKIAIEKIAKQVKADVVYYTFPLAIPKLSGTKVVHIIYDLIPYEITEEPVENEWLSKLAKRIDYVAHNSDLILTISQDSENKIKEVEPQAKIMNIGAAMSAYEYELASYTHDSPVLIKNGLTDKKYLLFISSIERRKNVHSLLQAFISISDKTDVSLVIVGNKTGAFKGIAAELDGAPKSVKNRVIFTGWASEYDKYTLLKNCVALVNPTLYEGFGLQPLEAMLNHIPAVSSVAGALAEVCGDAVLKIKNPYSVPEIAHALLRIVEDESLRKELVKKGDIQSQKYREQVMYKRLKEAFETL